MFNALSVRNVFYTPYAGWSLILIPKDESTRHELVIQKLKKLLMLSRGREPMFQQKKFGELNVEIDEAICFRLERNDYLLAVSLPLDPKHKTYYSSRGAWASMLDTIRALKREMSSGQH